MLAIIVKRKKKAIHVVSSVTDSQQTSETEEYYLESIKNMIIRSIKRLWVCKDAPLKHQLLVIAGNKRQCGHEQQAAASSVWSASNDKQINFRISKPAAASVSAGASPAGQSSATWSKMRLIPEELTTLLSGKTASNCLFVRADIIWLCAPSPV